MVSACIVIAQAVMLPIGVLVGRTADTWGHRRLFLVAFAALPLRAVLYTLSDNTAWLLGLQILDGLAAGIYGALVPLLVADITRGTGRFNMALGGVTTAQGIGGAVSGLLVGIIVDHLGYNAAFLTMGAVAGTALALFALYMPETAKTLDGETLEAAPDEPPVEGKAGKQSSPT